MRWQCSSTTDHQRLGSHVVYRTVTHKVRILIRFGFSKENQAEGEKRWGGRAGMFWAAAERRGSVRKMFVQPDGAGWGWVGKVGEEGLGKGGSGGVGAAVGLDGVGWGITGHGIGSGRVGLGEVG